MTDLNPAAYKQMANYIVKGCDPASLRIEVAKMARPKISSAVRQIAFPARSRPDCAFLSA
jgi:hypothetical protein